MKTFSRSLSLCCLLACLAACTSSIAQIYPSSSPTISPLAPSPSPVAASITLAAPAPIMVSNPRQGPSSFQSGVSLLVYGNDVSYQREGSLLFDQLATDNVNSIAIVFPLFQSGFYATDVHTDSVQTPSTTELAWLIQSAKARGFSVMLRPLIDERSIQATYGGWRGGIRPSSSYDWFVSYDSVILAYASFSQAQGVYAFDIGSELDTMERYTYRWQYLIGRIRAVYSGYLTYSSNFEARPIAFGNLLDFISVDAYYNVSASANPSIAEMIAGWHGYGLPDMLHRSALAGKPVVVTEVGVWPNNGVFVSPYGGSSSPYNPLAQQNYYAATCAALKPSVSGIYWWYVGLTQEPLGLSGHDPLSVPGTDQAIASCYAPAFTYPPVPTPFQRHHMNTD